MWLHYIKGYFNEISHLLVIRQGVHVVPLSLKYSVMYRLRTQYQTHKTAGLMLHSLDLTRDGCNSNEFEHTDLRVAN